MKKNCKHEYELSEIYPRSRSCKKCGLLKSTIDSTCKTNTIDKCEKVEKCKCNVEDCYSSVWHGDLICDCKCHKVKPEGVGEKGEYHATENGWCCACQYDIAKLSELIQEARDNFEERLEEYRNSPDVWKHVGISKWRNWGEKCGYFDYLSNR